MRRHENETKKYQKTLTKMRPSHEHDVQKYLSSKFSSVGELNGKVTTEIYLDSKDVCNTIKKGLQVVGYDSHLKQLYPLEKTI